MNPPIDATIAEIRARVAVWRADAETIVLVPTMGALHDGHLALVDRGRALGDRVVVSVFVNPIQFAPGEDFDSYPRDLDGDVARLSQRADVVFAPLAGEMYGDEDATTIDVGGPALGLESDSRPHFFKGVATIVTKLLLAVAPDIAVFGEKDYQQLLVIRRLVADLRLPIGVVGAPIVRGADGLALSSRNAYLNDDQRQAAPLLSATLREAAAAIVGGASPNDTLARASERLSDAGFETDYLELRDAETLEPAHALGDRPLRLLAAARLGAVRLIDNMAVTPTPPS